MSGVLFFMNGDESPSTTERDAALRMLRDWVDRGVLPEESEHWTHGAPLTRELVWTCLRHKGRLDAWIDHLSNKPPSPTFRPVLWLGFAQIFLLDGIADHAAVHETLETAKRAGVPEARIGFANALFRRALREKEPLRDWLDSQAPAARYSVPQFLFDRWEQAFGRAEAKRICEWNLQRSVTWARLTPKGKSLGSAADLPEGGEAHPDFPGFFQLPRGFAPDLLPDFEAGAWYIQDPSTSIAPAMLDPQPGERVVDTCAAPGGKTACLAESMGTETDKLLACEPNQKRMKRLKRNLERLGHAEVRTSTVEPGELDGDFEAALLDVPCSNTGVYQRRPDARWGFRKKALAQLAGLQYRLLSQTAEHIVPGGRMVYSTCGIEPGETTRQVAQWLSQHPDWRLDRDTLLLPGVKNCDGAYAALLRKQAV